MPVFRYQAIDKRGRSLGGLMSAQGEAQLERRLTGLGLWLTEAALEKPEPAGQTASKSQARWLPLQGKRRRRELIDFCTLMAFQVRVGIPLAKALEVAWEDCKDPAFQKVLSELQGHLESGLRFHEALKCYPNVFSPQFVSVVQAGESSGKLTETLEDLKEYLEWVDRVMVDVRQATMYPFILITVATAFLLLLFSTVIPKFAVLLDKLNVQQPLLTRIVLGASGIVTTTWWIWLPLLLFFTVGVPILRRRSLRFARALDRLKLRLPIFGELNRMLAMSRFARNLAMLYDSGIPILEALGMCQHGLIGNTFVEQAVAQASDDIRTGSTIGDALHLRPVFSALLLRMVAVGESTGKLGETLQNVASYYNEVIPRRIKSVFTVLESALMLFMISMIGCIALAIYLPIITLMGNIR
jgi:type IV pilus assembly protein PilC